MRVVIYARCSTTRQEVDMQLKDLREYVKARGMELLSEFVDHGISGSVAKRPELDRLMDAARKRKFDLLLVWDFSRFARSTRHLIQALYEFRSLGIGFLSFRENIDTTSPLGEAVFTICAAMAQLERDIIRERVRSGLKAARAKGKIGGRKKTRDDEAIYRLHKSGESIRGIAQTLEISKGSVQASLAVLNASKIVEPIAPAGRQVE